MRILVTGATGFIGRALIARFADHHVIALVRPGRPSDLDIDVIEADLSHPLDVSRLPRDIDAVVHLAQPARSRQSGAERAEFQAIHVASTAALLGWAERAGATCFCLASSGSVYEPYSPGNLREDAPLAPSSAYAASKLVAEKLLAPYGSRFDTLALRLFFPYGPGQKDRLIPDLFARIREERAVELPMNGEGIVLCPTFIDDVANVLAGAITDRWSGTYNVASPDVVTLHKLSEAIGRALGREPIYVRTANVNSSRIVPDLTRLSARCDLTRFTSLEEGLKRTVRNWEP